MLVLLLLTASLQQCMSSVWYCMVQYTILCNDQQGTSSMQAVHKKENPHHSSTCMGQYNSVLSVRYVSKWRCQGS